MAEKLCNLRKRGGCSIDLLGSEYVSSTSGTLSLSTSMNGYKFILFSTIEFDGNVMDRTTAPSGNMINYPVLGVVDYNYFKNTTFSSEFSTGTGTSQSPITPRTISLTYVDDTTVSYTKSATTGRTIYTYGIK